MRLIAPAHCTGLSHEGRAYHVDANGVVEIEDRLAPLFLAHGFVPCVAGHARRAASSCADAPDIDALSRNELFALLREWRVRVRLPITNAALRAAARRVPSSTSS